MANEPDNSGDQTFQGTSRNEHFNAGAGDDTVYGAGGRDLVYGGEGDDTIYGGEERDYLHGDAGDDTIYGGVGDDVIEGGAGDDTLSGGDGADTFEFSYTDGDDTITDFSTDEDVIDLLNISGVSGFSDLTITQEGDDAVIDLSAYSGGTITLENVSVDDLSDVNFVFRMTGTAGEDTLTGGAGREVISSGAGADTVDGGAGDDTIYGGAGDDTLKGGAGDDELVGGAGDDRLEGGTGDDYLDGNDGADTFVYSSGDGDDTIAYFTNGEDTIDLSAITDITEFSDLTITQEEYNTVIDLSDHGGGSITLQLFTGTLDADDFIFHEPATPTTDDAGDGM